MTCQCMTTETTDNDYTFTERIFGYALASVTLIILTAITLSAAI